MSAHDRAMTMSPGQLRLGDLGTRIISPAAIVGVAGVAVTIAMGWLNIGGARGPFWRTYLVGFMFALTICLGALFFVMLQHAVRAGWSVVIRRIAEGVASNLMWLWIAFIPIVIGMKQGVLYDWVTMPRDEHSAPKYLWYLTPGPWLGRAIICLAIWAVLAWFFVGNSTAQDSDGDIRHTYRMQRFAPLGLLLYALSQTCAAMDWVMSLESHWFSTMFPVYFFAASCCGYFAFQILAMFVLQRGGKLQHEITPEHYQDAGKLLFAFGIVFWAYISFSQFMLIWYANLPEETTWFLARWLGGWRPVSMALLFGHFVIPFLLLISRHPKRRMRMLAAAAAFMLAMHFVDIYWVTKPRVPEAVHFAESYTQLNHAVIDPKGYGAEQFGSVPGFSVEMLDVNYGWKLIDLTAALGMLGLIVAGTAIRLSGVALIPQRDPRLHESLAFENI